MAAIYGYAEPLRILCARELQNSIKESMLAEIKAAIHRIDVETGEKLYPWLVDHYDIGENYITGKNGTDFLFKGLRHNIASVKSTTDIAICIIEEAEDVPETAWIDLEPTIRAPKSEIWPLWNPRTKGSPVDVKFRGNALPPRSAIIEMSWRDNPWFGLTELAEQRKHHAATMDPSLYAHIWEGAYLERDDSKVFRNWRAKEFEAPSGTVFRFGADWGFSSDPTVLIRCYIVGRELYIDYEAYQVGCEIVDTPALFMSVPECERWPVRADSARPETISYMRNHGFPKIHPAIKGPKSVEDGIAWLQSFELIVHPRCENVIRELSTYSYKRDPLTNKVTPILEDKNNHLIDALRYACEEARRVQVEQSRKQAPAVVLPMSGSW